jgi:hypothetical protein
MGGTIDGEIYEYLTDKQRHELEEVTKQDLVPLTAKEAELAKLLSKDDRAPLFAAKYHTDNLDLEKEIKEFLKEKGHK